MLGDMICSKCHYTETIINNNGIKETKLQGKCNEHVDCLMRNSSYITCGNCDYFDKSCCHRGRKDPLEARLCTYYPENEIHVTCAGRICDHCEYFKPWDGKGE